MFLHIHKDTSAFIILQINPSITHHKNEKYCLLGRIKDNFTLHVWESSFLLVVVGCAILTLTISIFPRSLLNMYSWICLFPSLGRVLACLLGWLCMFEDSH